MKKSYVATSLGQFLNEQKSITLTRKYGEKTPVVVGSRAPLRNTVLSYVAENQRVSRMKLKKFIAGLNEGSKNPNASANMWLKRNAQFFITEERNGIVTYKLSKLGEKLLERMIALAESKINEKDNKDYDFKVNGKKGIHDKKNSKVEEKCDESEEEVEEVSESREERIKKIVEQIRAKRAQRLYEEDEIEAPEEDEEDEEGEESAEDVETPDEESEEGEDEEAEEEVEDDDKVEVTEFIISVDDVEAALAELQELGIEAEEVSGEEDEMDMDMDMDLEEPEEGEEEVEDFDLDLGGDIEGEEEDMEGEEEIEEMNVSGFGKDNTKSFKKSDPALLEDDDELDMDDLEGEESEEEFDMGGEEDLELDMEGEEGEEEFDMEENTEGEKQIKVSAENWPQLKKWLEEKGVDIEEMFGGEIEMEGEDVEDEISFDGLEDTGEEKGGKEEDEKEEVEVEDEEGEEEEDEKE